MAITNRFGMCINLEINRRGSIHSDVTGKCCRYSAITTRAAIKNAPKKGYGSLIMLDNKAYIKLLKSK